MEKSKTRYWLKICVVFSGFFTRYQSSSTCFSILDLYSSPHNSLPANTPGPGYPPGVACGGLKLTPLGVACGGLKLTPMRGTPTIRGIIVRGTRGGTVAERRA